MFRFCHPKCRLSHTRRSFVIFTGPAGVDVCLIHFTNNVIEIQNWAKRNAWQQCVHLSVDLVLWGLLSDWWVGEPHGWWGVGPGKCSQVLPVGPSTSTQRYISVKNCVQVIYPTYPWGPFKFGPSNRNSAVFFPSKKFVTVMLNLYFIFMEESE